MTTCRHDGAAAARERLAAALCGRFEPPPGMNDALLERAEVEGVAPLLVDRLLARHGDGAQPRDGDDAQARALRDRALREAAGEIRRAALVREALDALARDGVPALVFKGGALAYSHYPRPELRARDDTDLLVEPARVAVADRALAALGLERVAGNEGALIMRQRLYRRRDADGCLHNLDLHWAITNSARAAAALSPRALRARAVALPALGAHALAPCPVDALLIACLHLDAHHPGELRLVWLHDVHLLLGRMPLAERVHAADVAAVSGLASACAWVLCATRDAFATPLEGFEILFEGHAPARPSPSRLAQWARELGHLPDARTRVAWLAQHALPPAGYMRRDDGDRGTPLAWLYARRALRGIGHLLRR